MSIEIKPYVKETIKMISDEISDILMSDDFYKDFRGKVYISDEQTFAKIPDENLIPRSIYITVKFNSASYDLGMAMLPVTINAVSEQNGLEVCQRLLFEFAAKYTQKTPIEGSEFDVNDYVKQIWDTPVVISNFNEVFYGFRSLFYMTGHVLIGINSAPILELLYYRGEEGEEPINLHEYMIAFSDSFDITPDTQPFYGTNANGKSEAKTASYAFSVTLFKVKNDFFKKTKQIKRKQLPIHTKFNFKFLEKDDIEYNEQGEEIRRNYYSDDFILVNYATQQNKGDLPVVSLTFAR